MLRHLTEWLKEIAGLWMMIGILTVVFLVFSAAKHLGFTANSKIAEVNQELSELSYEKYNGINLSGSEVINAIKRYQQELPVTVYTGESVDTYKGNFRPADNNRKSERYIKPSQSYTGSILKNADKEIVGLAFAKEGVMPTEASYKELLAELVGADVEKNDMGGLMKRLRGLIKEKDGSIENLTQESDSLETILQELQSKNNALHAQVSYLSSQAEAAKAECSALLNEISEGKRTLAAAITEKGVAAAAEDSFSVMSTKISEITTGRLQSESYTYKNDAIAKKAGLQLDVTAQNMIPEMVVIQSDMQIIGAYNMISNRETKLITASKYSNENYTFSDTQNQENASIRFDGKRVSIDIKPSNYWLGGYLLVPGGDTKVILYGQGGRSD